MTAATGINTAATAPTAPAARRPRSRRLPAIGGERRGDDFLVVPGVDVTVGVSGVRPVDVDQLTPVLWVRCRLDERRPADFLVAVGQRLDDDELAAIVVDV